MIRRALYKLSGRLPVRIIDIDGRPYLERYYLGKALGLTFYLHRFVAADQDRHVHDHPWAWAFSLVLAGSYLEEAVRWFTPACAWESRLVWRRWWRPNLIRGRSFHRIHQAKPETWTLFMHTRTVKGWGFLKPVEAGHAGNNRGALYAQHIETKASRGWYLTAPNGRDSARVPLGCPACVAPMAECGYLSEERGEA